ncbi:MAG: class SAM-dependent methyltransferase [Acidimicrobiaceae bacterium]|nr:class SAM-dependent methyltransferase [Acidimicrobiaceae bacterium]
MRRRSPRDVAARAFVLSLLGRVRDGAVIVHEQGKRQLCGRPVAGERVPEVEVLSPQAWRAVATEGSAGLGRAYIKGWWTTERLDDLTTFLRVIIRNLDGIKRTNALARRFGGPLRRMLTRPAERAGEPEVDRKNVHAHLDLGNELFALFLDESMTYSSAIFAGPGMSLEDAQRAKLDRLCRKLALGPADHVLEIGSGWGSFAIHAARTYGCRVTTTTTSARQFEEATARVKEAALEDLVTVLEQDYRELEGTYDKLVSIEMIEELDWHQYDIFFRRCAELLVPDGIMALQAIVMADQDYGRAKHNEDFIKQYVFPGSCLPSIGAIVESATKVSDLRLVSLDDIGHHSAETLKRWRTAFAAAEDRVEALGLDEEFRRLFTFYFSYCEAAFAERRISDVQCVLAKARWRPAGLSLPTT